MNVTLQDEIIYVMGQQIAWWTPGQLLGVLLDDRPNLTRADVEAALWALETEGLIENPWDGCWKLR